MWACLRVLKRLIQHCLHFVGDWKCVDVSSRHVQGQMWDTECVSVGSMPSFSFFGPFFFFILSLACWQETSECGTKERAPSSSDALAHTHQQLHPDGDAGVPAQRQQADVTRYDGGPQQVLHGGGAVRVPVEDLRKRETKWLVLLSSFHTFCCNSV